MIKIALIIIVLFSFVSCENTKFIDYNLDLVSDKFIVGGMVSPKTNLSWIEIQKPLHPIEDERNYIDIDTDSLNVFLMSSNEKVASFYLQDSGIYILDDTYNPELGIEYNIQVEKENKIVAKSDIQYIPDKLKIDSVRYQLYEFDYLSYYYYLDVYIDKPDSHTVYFKSNFTPFYNDANLGSIDNFVSSSGISSDERTIAPYIYFRLDVDGIVNKTVIDSVTINVYSMSKDLYEFSNSLTNYDGSISNSFTDYQSPLFSNIEDGYGVFGAYNKSSITIIFDNELRDLLEQLKR